MSDGIALALILAIPFFWISILTNRTEKNNKKAVEKAISRGHVVTAVRKKTSIPHYDIKTAYGSGPHYEVTFEFVYKGKKYKYKNWMRFPTDTAELYFVDNPRKAAFKDVLYERNYTGLIIYAIVVLLFCF